MKYIQQKDPVIGEVYAMKFTGEDSEQSGWRPGVIFQNNVGNANSPNLIVLPMTSKIKKTKQPTHVLIKSENTEGLKCDSVVLCENPERMSKTKLGKYIAKVSDDDMKRIAEASLIATSAISFLDQAQLIRIWNYSTKLNNMA